MLLQWALYADRQLETAALVSRWRLNSQMTKSAHLAWQRTPSYILVSSSAKMPQPPAKYFMLGVSDLCNYVGMTRVAAIVHTSDDGFLCLS